MAPSRRAIERSWVIGVLLFVTARFVLAYSVIAEEGRVAVIVFGILDLGTAVPYALATARLVGSLVDRQVEAAARWGIVAAVSFLAPYIWLAWAGREGQFPPVVYVALALFVVCLGANAVLGIRRRTLEGRLQRQALRMGPVLTTLQVEAEGVPAGEASFSP